MARRTAVLLAFLLIAPGCGLFPYFGIDDIHEELIVAARRNDVQAIERMAKAGVDLDEPFAHSDDHWTPLQAAIGTQRVDAVRVLLEWGADPDATYAENKPPLAMALEKKNQAIVTLLTDAGAYKR